ncbi:glycosyltransferase [Herbiconiux sp.]|uniref:glycosyltransferase n=1 Tax=Herbiconiux sp. TaxID=1871186 RepID=UPI0025BB50DE|nr:glycosyltransferase [Herbiconiux sp.]
MTDTDALFGRPVRSGDVVAALTLFSGGLTWESCVVSLLEHTSPETPIVVFDDAGPSELAVEQLAAVEERMGRQMFYYRQPVNRGVVGNLNTAFERLAPADVIVLNSDIIVGPEWDTRLIAGARSRTDIATATALSANATIFTVEGPESWQLQPPSVEEFAQVATKVARTSQKIYPFVPVATSFCTFFARHALNIVGPLDEEFSPGYGEEVDYSLRCVSYGFNHIAVDDVYVYHATGESFGAVFRNQRKIDNDELVSRRFSYWDRWITDFINEADSPLERVKHHTSAVIHGITVAVDAELIHEALTGTFEGSFTISRLLALHPDVQRVIWVASPDRVEPLRTLLGAAQVDTIEVATLDEIVASGTFVDVAFRPYQDFTGATWPAISAYAHRNVIWTLDLIAVLTPHYSADYDDFARRNDSSKASWRNADAIGVLTPHVAKTLTSYYTGGTGDEKVFVLPNGSPEGGSKGRPWSLENPGIEELGDTAYALVLGTNFLYKNIPWIMRVGLMVKSMGWAGEFVFAGPTPDGGHSERLQQDLVELTGADCFHFLGRVSEADKERLINGATVVISPSITEGWGMIPAETVKFGSTPITTRGGGLGDIAPEGARFLGLRDDEEDARTLFELMTDLTARQQQRDEWEARVKDHQWSASAQTLVEAFFGTFLTRRAFVPAAVAVAAAPEPVAIAAQPRLRRRILDRSVVVLPVGSAPRRALKKVALWVLR